jgi:hypothetical protein
VAHTPRIALALAALVLAAGAARAVELGALEVASALGEPLDARVAVAPSPGERFEAACFYLTQAGLPEGTRLALALERSARGTALRIRGTTPLAVPAATLGIGVACPGREPQPAREYALLLDPRSRIRPATTAAAPAIGATINARGDASLESIARTMVPDDARARATYLEALGAANPSLASRGASAAIEAGTPVALPDLRTYAATRRSAAQGQVAPSRGTDAPVTAARAPAETERPRPPARASASKAATEPAPSRPAPPATATRPSEPAAPVAATAPPQGTTPPPPAAGAPRGAATSEAGFVLRLSGAEIDLSRSRGVDDRRRAQLRERQLVLDADDQLSALLAMKHSLKQLEARVSELQLKLAGMPASFPPAPTAPKAATAGEPAKAASGMQPPATAMPDRPRPPDVTATAPQKPSAESAGGTTTQRPPEASPAPAIAAVPEPAKAATAPAPVVKPPAAAAKPAAAKAPGTATPPARGQDLASLWREYGTWLLTLIGLAALALAYAVWRRGRAREAVAANGEVVVAPHPAEAPIAGDVGEIAAPVAPPVPEVPRASISSDAHLPTRLRDTDSVDLKRRYIEERFPEVASRAIRLEDTDSVVKGARLFYEDGELPRAIELLQLAIEARPAEARLWLALFEIFRLERLAGEFGELARRFRESHGDSEHWRKVRYFGREVDPGNPMYKAEPVATLETIGPREARKLAAANAAFDPIAENWLDAPMDFENEVLANDLRRSLMAEAGIAEQDLGPAPLAALRNVEMFTVA